MSNIDRIKTLGRAIYGERWQRPVAKLIGVSPKLIRKWLSGELNPINRHVTNLGTAAKSHIEDVAEAIQRAECADDH